MDLRNGVFAVSCIGLEPEGKIPPTLQIEDDKALRLAEHIWVGCTATERLSHLVREVRSRNTIIQR